MSYRVTFTDLARNAVGDQLAALEAHARWEIVHSAVGWGEPVEVLPSWGFHCFKFDGVDYIASFATDTMEIDRAASDSFEFDGNKLAPQGTYTFPIRASGLN